MILKIFLCVLIAIMMIGCGNKIKTLDEKLRRTILEFANGRLMNQFQYRAGYPVEIDKINIKATFKDDYTYVAVVTFKKKDAEEQKRQATLPTLGSLPSTGGGKSTGLSARFRYFEEEDRWYFETYV